MIRVHQVSGELVWDFNHNQLPTMLRLKSLNLSNNSECPLCNSGPETDDHLMLTCPEKSNITIWLRIQLTKLGCLKPLSSAINGDIGTCNNKKKILHLIQTYIITTWTDRCNNCTPTINELHDLWVNLQYRKISH